MQELVRAHLVVSGRVQGVYFRASTQKEGQRLGLAGWVRNLPSGEVEAEVEGPRAAVEELIAWCRRGPPAAQVEKVSLSYLPHTGQLQGFQVRYFSP